FHYRKGDMARAEGLLRQAMQLDKNDFMARFFYARMLDETGRAQQAQPYYTEVLRAVPEAADVHEAYARSLGSIGKTGLAYIHMAYSAIYSNNRKLAERYFKQAKAKTEKSADSAAFRKLDAVYKERKEIWEDR
ncbi:tetratricopeptide repeat protein, partial [Desulfovibrio sp.]